MANGGHRGLEKEDPWVSWTGFAVIKRDIGGDRQQIRSKDVRFDAVAFAHVLLPVWLLTVTYAGSPYQVLMNGVTGEVQGARPWSKGKLALAIGAGVLLVIAIVVLVLAMRG